MRKLNIRGCQNQRGTRGNWFGRLHPYICGLEYRAFEKVMRVARRNNMRLVTSFGDGDLSFHLAGTGCHARYRYEMRFPVVIRHGRPALGEPYWGRVDEPRLLRLS